MYFLQNVLKQPFAAHYQVPPRLQGQQETHAASSRDGEVPAVSDSGWDPLPPRQLGSPQGSGENRVQTQRLKNSSLDQELFSSDSLLVRTGKKALLYFDASQTNVA